VNAIETRALAAIDLDGLVATLCELIAFDSSHGQEVAAQQRMAALLTEAGMDVDLWEIDLPALKAHPAYGAEIERERALGLVGRSGAGDGPSLILNGHIDVVPAGELSRWSVPPFQGSVRDGRVYGRGAADMKGGLCCALYAQRALRAAGIELAGRLLIHSVAGEEDGGLGTLATVERGHTADAAIILEPTQLVIAPAQAGALSFRIRVPGRAAHGALRTEGVDPLDHFAAIHGALRALEARRNERLRHPLYADYAIPYAICTGKVEAGIWASTVAETLVIEGRYGVGIGEDADSARGELEAAIAEAAAADPWLREHPPVVEWWGARFMPADIPTDHRIVTTLGSAFTDACGHATPVRGVPYGADMHLLVHQGHTPTVIFGPGDVRSAHAPDEFVPIAELEATTRALVLAAMRFCGVAYAGPQPESSHR
jgi:acetylornithine deacetylase